MKEYFKYRNGYVNIDDETLYLTNSGNWSETFVLLEKSPKSIRKNKAKLLKINLYLFILGCLVVFFLLSSEGRVVPLALAGLGITAYFYMIKETGKRYKIPISKIKKIEIEGHQVKIIFLNLNDIEDVETIDNVEAKGIQILQRMEGITSN